MLIFGVQSHSSLKKITQTWCLGVNHIYKTWPVTAKNSIQSQFSRVHISPHEKEPPSGNPLFAAISYVFRGKKLPIISLALKDTRQAMLNFWKLSHDQACMWPPGNPNPPSCLKMKSYLCHLSKSGIYTTFYLRAIHIVKKHNIVTYFDLSSFKVTYLQS